MPWPLVERARIRCVEENYRSKSRYYLGCILRDVIAPQTHLLASHIANLEWQEQDEILDFILQTSPLHLQDIFVKSLLLEQRKVKK